MDQICALGREIDHTPKVHDVGHGTCPNLQLQVVWCEEMGAG